MPCTVIDMVLTLKYIFFRISILNRETAVIWSGNTKLYIKGNGSIRLKIEEYLTRMEKTCTIPEIGFGRGEIQSFEHKHFNHNLLYYITM